MAHTSALTKAVAPEQDDLYSRRDEAREVIASLEAKRKKLDARLAGMSGERQQYELLDRVCESLEKLDQMGAAHLFWGDTQTRDSADQVVRARAAATAFVQKIRDIEQESAALLDRIREEEWKIIALTDEIVELEEEEEAARNEFVVVRELADTPYRPMVMPWQGQAEDERRFRKSLSAALLVVLCLAVIVKLWIFPTHPEQEVVEIPKQLVRLVQTEHPKPPPVEKLPEQKESEASSKDTSKATTAEKQHARAKAMKSGVLAFKEGFSDLMQDSASLKLGSDARINTNGQLAVGPGVGSRSLVVAQAQNGGSGGINSASLSRGAGVGGGRGGNGIGGVAFTRVQSGVADMKGQSDRPLSEGPGPSRTDEEIQIVFDRYKAALYRMYQHELRSDPTLRGKMVLKITIEPNGSVSNCTIQSSDLASATLKEEVVGRVKKFNFGAKDGVSRITILYPIDFLPAT